MAVGKLDIRATTFLRNDAMLSAREHLGLTQAEAALRCGISKCTYMRLEKLDYPRRFDCDKILRIAVGLGICPDDIMAQSLAGADVPNKFITLGTVEVSHLLEFAARQARFILPSPADKAESKDLLEDVKESLSALSFKEREVVKLRYGLSDGHAYSLEECSRIFKVGQERIRQVESKAIRKLRYFRRVGIG